MRGNKWMAILLILVFSIPLMPIAQVGGLLSSNQLQEEIIHSTVAGEAVDPGQHLLHTTLFLNEPDTESLLFCLQEDFLSRQADDISTPPPNM